MKLFLRNLNKNKYRIGSKDDYNRNVIDVIEIFDVWESSAHQGRSRRLEIIDSPEGQRTPYSRYLKKILIDDVQQYYAMI